MATIIWNIVNMERILNGDYVIIAHWTCTASQNDKLYKVYGSQTFEYDPDQPGYIPYNQLTEAIVVGWVHSKLGTSGVASVEASATDQLNSLINPVVVVGVPWGSIENPSTFTLPSA